MKFFKKFCFLATIGTVVTSEAYSIIERITGNFFKTPFRSSTPFVQQLPNYCSTTKPPENLVKTIGSAVILPPNFDPGLWKELSNFLHKEHPGKEFGLIGLEKELNNGFKKVTDMMRFLGQVDFVKKRPEDVRTHPNYYSQVKSKEEINKLYSKNPFNAFVLFVRSSKDLKEIGFSPEEVSMHEVRGAQIYPLKIPSCPYSLPKKTHTNHYGFSTQKEVLEETRQVGIMIFSQNGRSHEEISRIIDGLYPGRQVTLGTFNRNQNEWRVTVEGLIKNTKIFFTLPHGHDYEERVRISDLYCRPIESGAALERLITTEQTFPVVLFGTKECFVGHPLRNVLNPYSKKDGTSHTSEVYRLLHNPLATGKFSLENLESL